MVKTLEHYIVVEDIERNHFVAWVLDLPGCFCSGSSSDEAIAETPAQITAYYRWLKSHDSHLLVPPHSISIKVIEHFTACASEEDPDYLVNGFFEDDKRPLTYWDVSIGCRILEWSRRELLHLVYSLGSVKTEKPPPIATKNKINEILSHIARAENWYFGHLLRKLDWSSLSDDPISKLEAIRSHTYKQLMILVGDTRIVINLGEKWSARKVLRRTIWHERDHTQHIAKLLAVNL